MRYILIIFSAFLVSFTVISCAIDELADKVTGSSSDDSSSDGSTGTYQLATNDYANGVATDSSGNVYVTGGTKGGLDGNTSAGNTDLFVVKYNSSGTKEWTKQLGSSSRDSANGISNFVFSGSLEYPRGSSRLPVTSGISLVSTELSSDAALAFALPFDIFCLT